MSPQEGRRLHCPLWGHRPPRAGGHLKSGACEPQCAVECKIHDRFQRLGEKKSKYNSSLMIFLH